MNRFETVFGDIDEFEDQNLYDEDTSATDSDEIDSDIEFHLYSQLHYASNEYNADEKCYEVEDINNEAISLPDEVEKNVIKDFFCENLLEPISDGSDFAGDDVVGGEEVITEIDESVITVKSGNTVETFDKNDLARLRSHLSESSETDFVPESWEIVDSVDDGDSDDAGLDIHISEKVCEEDVLDDQPNEDWIPGKGPKSCWKIDDVDKKIFTDDINSKGRYYGGPTKASRMRCHNCDETGHKAADCPIERKQPACFMCGVRGHVGRFCPERDALKQRGRNMICNRCEQEGHIHADCPDHWRQFHITTMPGPIVIPSIPIKLKEDPQCYNCAGYGHFGHECGDERFQLYHSILHQFVHRYDTKTVVQVPKDLRGKLSKKRSREVSPVRKTNRQRVEEEYRRAKPGKSKNNHIIFRTPSPKPRNVSKKKRNDGDKIRSNNASQSKKQLKSPSGKNDGKEHHGTTRSSKGAEDRFKNKSYATGQSSNKKLRDLEHLFDNRDNDNSKNFVKKNKKRKKNQFLEPEIPPPHVMNLPRFDERVVSIGNHDSFNNEQHHERSRKPGRKVTFKSAEQETPFPRNSKRKIESDDFFVSKKVRNTKREGASNSFKKVKSDDRTRFNGDRGFRRHFS